MKNKLLTTKQNAVLKYVYKTVRRTNSPPTIREIAKNFGFSSTGTVRDHLKALVKKGYIKIAANKSRAIELVKETLFSIPILGCVRAGLPTLAVEDIEGYLDLDSLVFSESDIFALRVKGDSMIGLGILPGDLGLVKRQSMAQTGETVVALIGDEATVKSLRKKGDQFYLEPANQKYSSILIDNDVSIIGRVISVIRKYR